MDRIRVWRLLANETNARLALPSHQVVSSIVQIRLERDMHLYSVSLALGVRNLQNQRRHQLLFEALQRIEVSLVQLNVEWVIYLEVMATWQRKSCKM